MWPDRRVYRDMVAEIERMARTRGAEGQYYRKLMSAKLEIHFFHFFVRDVDSPRRARRVKHHFPCMKRRLFSNVWEKSFDNPIYYRYSSRK